MESHIRMILHWKTEKFEEKPVPVSICRSQIPYGLTWAGTRASAVRGRWLSVRAMAEPITHPHTLLYVAMYVSLIRYFPSGRFPKLFPTKILSALPVSAILGTCWIAIK
jgi:hypothetical protein